jgi:hypothetical protein
MTASDAYKICPIIDFCCLKSLSEMKMEKYNFIFAKCCRFRDRNEFQIAKSEKLKNVDAYFWVSENETMREPRIFSTYIFKL